jgi:cytochrome c-type biogenesis protein
MTKLFAILSSAVEGVPLVAVAASFIWGTLSVLLSPCHLTSIPLIIGYISKQGKISAIKAFILSTLFSVGILMSIAIIGAITAAAGRIVGDIGKIGNYAVAVIFLIFGLNLLGIIPLNWTGLSTPKSQRKGYFSILSLGLVFGLALGPCTFAFMAPMLGIVFNLTASDLLYGLLIMAAFGAGHCSVIIAAGTSSQWVQRIANLNEKSSGVINLRRLCGVLVLLGGIYLVYATF